MAYIGQDLGLGQAERFIFTASGSEEVVSADDDGRLIGYTVGQVSVYLNGVKLVVGTDCVATNGSTITGLSALSASDVVEVIALSAFSPSDTVSASTGGTFSGAVTASAGFTANTADINGGTFDGVVGGTTPATGNFTTIGATGAITGNLTGNASGTAATVTTAAQPAITSVGTLTALTGGTGDLNWDSNTLVVDSSESRVGIGTTAPTTALDVVDNNNSIQLSVRGRSSDDFGIIDFKNNAGTASKGLLKSDASSNLIFRAGPTNDVLAVRSDGDVTVSTGNLVIGTAGKGITFSSTNTPAQSAGTGTGNTLDDYEEGTWTPAPVGGTMVVNSTSGKQARYIKIGKMVWVQAFLGITTGGNTTALVMSGLPFTCMTHGYSPFVVNHAGTTVTNPYGRFQSGGTTLNFFKNAQSNMPQSDMGSVSDNIIFSGTYEVA